MSGITVFHATTSSRLDKIKLSGFIKPQASEGLCGLLYNKRQEDKYKGFIFVTVDLNTAVFLAMKARCIDGSRPVILEIVIDENVLLPDDIDMPEATNWRESAEHSEYHGAKIEGNLSSEFIIQEHLLFS